MREDLIDEIREQVVLQLIEKSPWIPKAELASEARELANLSNGYGPFTEILKEESFSDLFINGSAGTWINRGIKLEPLTLDISERVLINYIRNQALRAGKQFDPAHPAVDLELGKGVRLHAILPPVIEGGVHISLRVNQQRALLWSDPQIEEIYDLVLKPRKNFLISGGTGSGKTTLLSHLIERLPSDERILVIEDTHEIQASHPHLLRLQARGGNSEGVGEIPIRELIRQALRMKPDRIFLGEVRGADVVDLFLALNTGHAGSAATIHANSAADIPNRIAALAMSAGIARESALALFTSAIDYIIHLAVTENGERKVLINEVTQ